MQKFAFSVGKRFIIEWREESPRIMKTIQSCRILGMCPRLLYNVKNIFWKNSKIYLGWKKKYNVDYIVDCKNLRFWLECKNLRLWFLDFFMREMKKGWRWWRFSSGPSHIDLLFLSQYPSIYSILHGYKLQRTRLTQLQ